MRGFTLLELMVTLALLALIASIALPMTELTMTRNKEAELHGALRQIRESLDAYKQAADEGHIAIRPGDSGYPKNLAVLVDGVEDAKSPTHTKMNFLRRIPRDPFADLDQQPEDTWGMRSYQSPHDNPKPGDDVYDVYSLSTDTGINGVPYRDW